MIAKARAEGIELLGENGLLRRLTKTALENVLQAEMDEHLGYAKHERASKSDGIGGERAELDVGEDGDH